MSFGLMRGVGSSVSKNGYHAAEINRSGDLPDHRRRFPDVGHRDPARRHPVDMPEPLPLRPPLQVVPTISSTDSQSGFSDPFPDHDHATLI